MKKLFLALILLFSATAPAYSKISLDYSQSQETISNVDSSKVITCTDNKQYSPAQDLEIDASLFEGKTVYIKFFTFLEKDYYTDIRELQFGPFEFPQKEQTSLTPAPR